MRVLLGIGEASSDLTAGLVVGSERFTRLEILSMRCLLRVCLGLLLATAVLSEENQALYLDGKGGHAVLPAGIFDGLTESTVELWAKWEDLRHYSQAFAFGSQWQSMGLNHWENTPALQFFIYDKHRALHLASSMRLYDYQSNQPMVRAGRRVGDILTGRWHHLATVAGTGGMKLYLDGVLVSRNEYAGSFADIGGGSENYLGRSHWASNADFQGHLDEVRVWSTVRTPQQLRASMYRRLTGSEAGLAGLWDFNTGDGTDRSAGGHHARIVGGATFEVQELPNHKTHLLPSVLHGTVYGPQSEPLPGARVVLEKTHAMVARTWTDADGAYTLVAPADTGYVVATTHGEMGIWQAHMSLPAGKRQEFNPRLHKAVSISGQLQSRGRTRPHSPVLVEAEGGGVPGRLYRTFSDESGHYRFLNLEPGLYTVRVPTPDGPVYFDGEKDRRALRVGDHTQRDIDIRLTPLKKAGWRQFTWLDGLAGNALTSLALGKDGVLWAGTDRGLSRFDGARFANYRQEDGLADDQVTALALRGDGVLWLGTEGGLSRFDGAEFNSFTSKDGLAADHVTALALGDDGTLWVGTVSGLSAFNGGEFRSFRHADGLPNDRVRALYQEPGGPLWVGTQVSLEARPAQPEDGYAGLSSFDGVTFTPHLVDDLLTADNTVLSITGDGRRGLWLGLQRGGLVHYDGSAFSKPDLPDNLPDWVSVLRRDDQGVLWAGARDGLWRFDGKSWLRYLSEDGLVREEVVALQADARALWVGTVGGLTRYDNTLVNYGTDDGLPANGVTTLGLTERGNLLVGTTSAGYSHFDGRRFETVTAGVGIPDDLFSAFHQAGDGHLWLGTRGWGLVRSDSTGLRRFTEKEGLISNQIRALHGSRTGGLWIGTEAGLSHFQNGRFRSYGVDEGLDDVRIRDIHEDAGGALWLGTRTGLVRFRDDVFTRYTTSDGLADDRINALREAKTGGLWIGTDGGLSNLGWTVPIVRQAGWHGG
jgi:ligand-binding sensor domain-containing protein